MVSEAPVPHLQIRPERLACSHIYLLTLSPFCRATPTQKTHLTHVQIYNLLGAVPIVCTPIPFSRKYSTNGNSSAPRAEDVIQLVECLLSTHQALVW